MIDPKTNLDCWAQINSRNAEYEITKKMLIGIYLNSPNIDKFSLWLLAGVGATVALIISNSDRMSLIIPAHIISYTLFALALSMLFGVISKYLSLVVKNMSGTISCIELFLPSILDNYSKEVEEIKKTGNSYGIEIKTEINFHLILEQFKDGLPFWIKIFVSKGFEKGQKDPLYSHKKIARSTCFQSLLAGLQALMIIISIFLISYSLHPLKSNQITPTNATSQAECN